MLTVSPCVSRSFRPSSSLDLTRNAGSPSPSSVPASLSFSGSVPPGRFPRTEEGVWSGGSTECCSLALSLSLSLSLSPRSGFPDSSCLTAPTCPWLCHSVSPTRSQPASVRPSVPRPLLPRLCCLPLRPNLPSHAAGTVAGGRCPAPLCSPVRVRSPPRLEATRVWHVAPQLLGLQTPVP